MIPLFLVCFSPDAAGGGGGAPASGGSAPASATSTPAAPAASTSPVAGGAPASTPANGVVAQAAAADPAVAAAVKTGDPQALLAALEAHFSPVEDPSLGGDDPTKVLTAADWTAHEQKRRQAQRYREFQGGLRDVVSKPYNVDLPGGEKLSYSFSDPAEVNAMMTSSRDVLRGNVTPRQLFVLHNHDRLLAQAFEAGASSYEKKLRAGRAAAPSEAPAVQDREAPVVVPGNENLPSHMKKVPSVRDILAARNPEGLKELEEGKFRFGKPRPA